MKDREARVQKSYGGEEVKIFNRQVTTHRADIALELACRWGLVAAECDGEDSAGRAKLRRMTTEEITQHACDTAAALWEEFEKRDWLLDLPLPRTDEELKAESLKEGK